MQKAAMEGSLRGNIKVLRRRKWLLVLGAVLGVALALGYSLTRTKQYSATAQVLLQPSSAATQAIQGPSSQYIYPATVATEVQLVTSAEVRGAVAKSLHLPFAPGVKAGESGTTNIIDITATATVPSQAANIANAYSNAYIGVRRLQTDNALLGTEGQIQSTITSLQAAINNPKTSAAVKASDASQLTAATTEQGALQLASTSSGGPVPASPAVAPSSPSSPHPTREGIIGLVVGLLVGAALAYLIDYLDDAIKGREDLVSVVPNLPVLGIIPAISTWKDRGSSLLVSVTEPRSQAAEHYRTLRTSLQFISMDNPISVLLVTSASESEGKSTTLANLAVAMAQAGHSVIVLCCDLRRPRVHEFFGLTNEKGFTSVLLGEVPISAVLQQVPGVEGLSVMASGPLPPNPADLLSSMRTAEVIKALRGYADLVLIDSPPVLPVTDAAVLSDVVDATLLVATAGKSTGRDLARAVEILGSVRAPLLGTVLNAVKGEEGYGNRYGNRYGYVYGDTPGDRRRHTRPTGGQTSANDTLKALADQ